MVLVDFVRYSKHADFEIALSCKDFWSLAEPLILTNQVMWYHVMVLVDFVRYSMQILKLLYLDVFCRSCHGSCLCSSWRRMLHAFAFLFCSKCIHEIVRNSWCCSHSYFFAWHATLKCTTITCSVWILKFWDLVRSQKIKACMKCKRSETLYATYSHWLVFQHSLNPMQHHYNESSHSQTLLATHTHQSVLDHALQKLHPSCSEWGL